MRFGYSADCLRHDPGARHPESPDRLRAIREELAGHHGVEYVDADAIAEDRAREVHDHDYIDRLREFCTEGGGQWDADTTAVEATWMAALESAGLAVWAADEAMAGETGRKAPFSLGRPPGHHATADDAMGFCFLNNVAIAAQSALDDGAERVAIIDWDVHHGNGTQDVFDDRADVCYCSIHEDGLYPGTGAVEETGKDDGAGRTVNVPFPAGSGDDAYITAFDSLFEPILAEFDPGLVLVSAGFDAHQHDPISRMSVSTETYGVLAARARSLADRLDAGLAYVLEGGYGLETLSDGVAMTNGVFGGYEPVEPDGEPGERAAAVIENARKAHGLGAK